MSEYRYTIYFVNFQIGHSLLRLVLSNSFDPLVKEFPEKPMQHLISLQFLDVSFNNFEYLPMNSFHAMHELEVLRAQDCHIRELSPETFSVRV